jgi:hypothetical protein
VTSVTVTLPPGNASASWHSYWLPNVSYPAGATFQYATPLTTSVTFVRNGALVPLHVSTHLGTVPYGDATWAGALTVAVHSPDMTGARVATGVRLWKETGIEVSERGRGGGGEGGSMPSAIAHDSCRCRTRLVTG